MNAARSEPLLQITLLGEAVEHAPVGIFVFDERGEYVAVNLYGCELVGHEREEILGSRLGDFAAEPQDALRAYRTVVDRPGESGVTRVRRGDGEIAALRFRASETVIGGLTFYLGIAWREEPEGETAAGEDA